MSFKAFEINELTAMVLEWQRTKDEQLLSKVLDKIERFIGKQSLIAYRAIERYRHADLYLPEFEDIRQQVIVYAIKAAHSYSPKHGTNFFTYLHACHLAGTVVSRNASQFSWCCIHPAQVERLAADSPVLSPPCTLRRSENLWEEDYARLISVTDIRMALEEAFKSLRPRDRDFLIRRFGLRNGVEKLLQEIADEEQLTRERVRQICGRAIQDLQKQKRIQALRQQE